MKALLRPAVRRLCDWLWPDPGPSLISVMLEAYARDVAACRLYQAESQWWRDRMIG